jgi:hypothetical protein
MVGGISSVLQGGEFGHGFFSAGVTKGLGGQFLPGGSELEASEVLQGTVASAIIGGTASAVSGGKFANGAQMGAMQYMLNQVRVWNPFRGKYEDIPEGHQAYKDENGQLSLRQADGTIVTIDNMSQMDRQMRGDYGAVVPTTDRLHRWRNNNDPNVFVRETLNYTEDLQAIW